MIIDRGEAEVDNHFRRVKIPKLLSGEKRYVNGSGEEGAAF